MATLKYNNTTVKKVTYNSNNVKKWVHNNTTVFLSGNNVTYHVGSSTYTEFVEYGQDCLHPKTFTPSLSGQKFMGWSTTSTGDVLTSLTMGNNPITLYARGVQTVYNYSYTGGIQSFTAPVTATYRLEVWGARGGAGADVHGATGTPGKGGYARGNVKLSKGAVVYIVVGQKGQELNDRNNWLAGGYNGGGVSTRADYVGGGGGGATHMGTKNATLPNYGGTSGLYIVAGGGGGAGCRYDEDWSTANLTGGSGGGTNGGTTTHTQVYYPGEGGSQTQGGRAGNQSGFSNTRAGFGQGMSNRVHETRNGAGGGGLYGGGAGAPYAGGGGGSGYIGGVSSGYMSNGTNTGDNGSARITPL